MALIFEMVGHMWLRVGKRAGGEVQRRGWRSIGWSDGMFRSHISIDRKKERERKGKKKT